MGAIALLYGVACYGIFFATFLYLVAFLGGNMVPLDLLPFSFDPITIDSGGPVAGTMSALLVNTGLLALFGLSHTIMARSGFKDAIKAIVPPSVERSTYVLIASLLIILIYAQWRPMPGVVWAVENNILAMVLTVGFFVGFGIVLLSTFLINHFELFGLSQVLARMQNKTLPEPTFRTPFLYKLVRHPLYLGWMMTFWLTPNMTQGHLLLAVIWTAYIYIAMVYEERDLVGFFGQTYEDYKRKVPKIIPFWPAGKT